MSRLDYSKWDHIEISDDEDDTHPNIDTPSLFRWRHQARVERMEEQKQSWEKLNKEKQEYKKKLSEVEKKLKNHDLNEAEMKKALMTKEEIAKQMRDFEAKEDELAKKDKLTPWNVDTICKEGFSKSVINKPKVEETKSKTEDEIYEEQKKFQENHKQELQTFGMLSKAADSRKYLQDHPHLISEKAANYLVIWCIDLEVEEKTSLMERVAHQTIVLQFILQLAIQMKTDPRNCYNAFFNRIENEKADYMDSFFAELNSFKGRVKERAAIRIEEAMKRYKEEQRELELGPGGLHPVEVMESLPPKLQECFESQNVEMLQEVIKTMDSEQAAYHMKRCVDSGLWVPDAKSALATKKEEVEDEGAKITEVDTTPEVQETSQISSSTENSDGTQV